MSNSKFHKLKKRLKFRAVKAGMACDVSTEFLRFIWNADTKCQICSVSFVLDMNSASSKSIDRFNSELGYTKDNVHVMCRRCNSIKSVFDRDGLSGLRTYQLRNPRMPVDNLIKWITKNKKD
jgi:5-methylcytosine-specific restriction endonuclease McrA